MMGGREAIGETEFEQQQILGYAPVEPDGSFKLHVPADTPLGLAIVDAKGRAIQTHLNWIQVRPGERRTCDGCHSPRRGASLNSGALVNPANQPGSWLLAPGAGRDDGQHAHAPGSHGAAVEARHGLHRRLGQPGRGWRGARAAGNQVHRQRQPG